MAELRGGDEGGHADVDGEMGSDRATRAVTPGFGSGLAAGLRVGFESRTMSTRGAPGSRPTSQQQRQRQIAWVQGDGCGSGGIVVGGGGDGTGGDGDGDGDGVAGVSVDAGGGGGVDRRRRDLSHPPPHGPSQSASAHSARPVARRTCESKSTQPTLKRGVLDGGISGGGVNGSGRAGGGAEPHATTTGMGGISGLGKMGTEGGGGAGEREMEDGDGRGSGHAPEAGRCAFEVEGRSENPFRR